jgi:hypothetical protein
MQTFKPLLLAAVLAASYPEGHFLTRPMMK